MAVYRRGYQRYDGPLTGHWTRLLALPHYAWQRLMQQRIVVIMLVVSLFWPLACAAFIYLSNHVSLLEGFGGGQGKLLEINATFFLIFMNAQSVFAILLSAFAGPSLIAPDLANNALPLYFSRPVSRVDYVLTRFAILLGLLSPITWIPGLLLFLMQSGMAGGGWAFEHWRIGVGIVAGFMLWIAMIALVAMACSAYVKWRVVSGALVLGFFFVLSGAAAIAQSVLRAGWVSAFDPARAMYQVWCSLLGAAPIPGAGTWECTSALALTAAALIAVLERKLRPVEVIK